MVRIIILMMIFMIPFHLPQGLAQEEDDPSVSKTVGVEEGEEELLPEEGEEEEFEEEEDALEEELEGVELEIPEGGRKITINGAVTLNYVFVNSTDSFVVKYSFQIEGAAPTDTSVIKGDVDITAQVEGFLATWPTGECKLDIVIPKVPFEMIFRKMGDDQARINMRFKQTILETWSSKCQFPGGNFDTVGAPEKWLTTALAKARPPFSSLGLKLDSRDPTSVTFTIKQQVLPDPPIGTAEIQGTGVVTITPGE